MSVEQLKDFDNFFYYGEGDIKNEIASDLQQILVQQKRSLLYSRSRNAAGILENAPNSISMKVLLPFDIVSSIAQRNLTTGNGQNGSKERRVAVSQNQIEIKQKGSESDISVFYIPFNDIKQKSKVGFQIGLNGRG